MNVTTVLSLKPTSRFSDLLRRVSLPGIWPGTWMKRRNQRLALVELDDHLIADIGRQQCEVDRECAKPLWRA